MAVTPTNGYCDGTVLKAALQINDVADDVALTAAIDAASRTIDEWCGRRFYADASDTTRYFTPTAYDVVELHGGPTSVDLVSVTSVTVDPAGTNTFAESWTEGQDFVLGPRSAAAEGWPYTRLFLLGGTVAPVGQPESVKIVGKFGWATVPVPVVQACVALSQQMFKELREAPFGAASFDLDGGVMRMSRFMPGNVEMLLRPFRRVGVGGYV